MSTDDTPKDPHAPKNADGLAPYVVSKTSWGRTYNRIEYAANLTEAKKHFGWTRELHTSITVRRARVSDVAADPRAGSRA